MRRAHDLLPRVRGELALREEPPDVVVEDLRRGARDRAEPVLLARGEELFEGHPHLRGAVQHLHRAERVDVDLRHPTLHRVEEVEVERAGQVGMDPALHAHLARAAVPRLLRAVGDLVQRERVGLRIDLALREGAEPASDVADVREVDVPVDHVRHDVADGLLPEAVGDPPQRLQGRALGLEERESLGVGDRAVALRGAERPADLRVEALGRHVAGRAQALVTSFSGGNPP